MATLDKLTEWHNRRRIGRVAWGTAWFGLVVGQLHALSRHATADGKADLDLPLTRMWAEPAARALRPLLDWAGPDAVYVTYGKIWLPVFAAFTLSALVVHHFRRPVGFEKWAWRIALTGYSVAVVSLLIYWVNWTSYSDGAITNAFFAVALVGLLLTMLGSTALGIALIRNQFPSRTAAWMLTLALPLAFLIAQITSMGSLALPMMFAFGIVGRNVARDPSYVENLVAEPTRTRAAQQTTPASM